MFAVIHNIPHGTSAILERVLSRSNARVRISSPDFSPLGPVFDCCEGFALVLLSRNHRSRGKSGFPPRVLGFLHILRFVDFVPNSRSRSRWSGEPPVVVSPMVCIRWYLISLPPPRYSGYPLYVSLTSSAVAVDGLRQASQHSKKDVERYTVGLKVTLAFIFNDQPQVSQERK